MSEIRNNKEPLTPCSFTMTGTLMMITVLMVITALMLFGAIISYVLHPSS